MAQQSLNDYVARMRSQGFSASSIRQSLIRSGYPAGVVDEAIRATAKPRKISTKILAISFLVIVLLTLGTIIVLKIMEPPSTVLSYDIQLFSSRIQPKGELLITTTITNPSGREVTGLLDYTISGPEGTLKRETQEFKLKTQTSISKSFQIPKDALPGNYKIKVDLSHQTTKLSKSKTFEVQEIRKPTPLPAEEVVPEEKREAIEAQTRCPTRCDDFDFCTRDSCIEGRCVNDPITPCCGNNQCEQGETEQSCALDCAERRPQPEEISAKAAEQATKDIELAMTTCESLVQQAYIDSCLLDVSESSDAKRPCEFVSAEDMQDACYIPFAYNNDFTVCDKINNPSTQNTCYTLKEISDLSDIPEVKEQIEKQTAQRNNG